MNAMNRSAARQSSEQSNARKAAPPWKGLRRILATVLARRRMPSIEEQYLAQAVDAQDLQVRLSALERARP